MAISLGPIACPNLLSYQWAPAAIPQKHRSFLTTALRNCAFDNILYGYRVYYNSFPIFQNIQKTDLTLAGLINPSKIFQQLKATIILDNKKEIGVILQILRIPLKNEKK